MTIIYILLLILCLLCAGAALQLRSAAAAVSAVLWRICDRLDGEAAAAQERHHSMYALMCENTEFAERQLQAEIGTQGLVARLADEHDHPPDRKAAEGEKEPSVSEAERRREKAYSEGVLSILGYSAEVARKRGDEK